MSLRSATYPVTVAQLAHMDQTGILVYADLPIQLIGGHLTFLPRPDCRNMAAVRRLSNTLPRLAMVEAIVDIGRPVTVGADTMVLPQVSLLKPSEDYYASGYPTGEDLLSVFEFSEPDAERLALFAKAKVTEVCIGDIEARTLTVHTCGLSTGHFHQTRTYTDPAEDIRLINIRTLTLRDFFG